jgi:hypothetical protein
MIEFLENHFRYDTMSSWNASTSYANKVKIHSVIPNELTDKVYELMECEEFYDNLRWILDDFADKYNQQWQAGFNGRSNGYIVLYQGGKTTKTIFEFNEKETNSYHGRDYADGYGWMDIKEAKQRGLYKKQIVNVNTYPGRSTDMHEDFSDWSTDDLKARVKLVCAFDKMCDDVVNETIRMAKEDEVKEETYTVTKTRKVIA